MGNVHMRRMEFVERIMKRRKGENYKLSVCVLAHTEDHIKIEEMINAGKNMDLGGYLLN